MLFLTRKLRRDIVRNWTQFFSVFLMAFLSVLIYVGLEGAWHGMDTQLNRYIKDSNLANEWVAATGFQSSDVDAFKSIKGVSDLALKTQIQVTAKFHGSDCGYLNLETLGSRAISKPIVKSGEGVSSNTHGIWIDTKYADKHGISVGDSVELSYQGTNITVRVAGTIYLSDKIYYTGSSDFSAPEPSLYGYSIINDSTLSDLGYKGGANFLEIRGTNTQVRTKAPVILKERYLSYSNRNTLTSISTATSRVEEIRNLSVLFSFIFILLSILSMYTTIRRLIEKQTIDIATLKAIGYSNRTLGFHYASYGICVGGAGALAGVIIAPIMSSFVLGTQQAMFSTPYWAISYTIVTPVIILSVIFICALAAFFASFRARHGLPAAFMRNNGKKAHRSFIEHFSHLWNRLSYGSRWTWRDGTSNPARILMGIIGICGCMMLLMAGFGMPDSMHGQITDTFGKEFTYNAKAHVSADITPADYLKLKIDYQGQWIESVPTRITPDDGYDRVLTIVGNGKYIHLTTTEGKNIEDDGIYVTEGAAKMLGVKIGNTVTVTTPTVVKEYHFTVKGILKSSFPQGVYITEKTWVNAGGFFSPMDLLSGNGTSVATLKNDKRFSQVITLNQQQDNANALVAGLESIFMLIRVFAIILAVVVLYNLGSLSFAERQRDYTTLRVLGFHRNEIRMLAMRENLLTTLIGWLIGIPAGFWFLTNYVDTFSTFQIVYYAILSTLSFIISSGIAIICSLTTTFLIGRRIRKLDMVMAIKGIE